MEKTEDARVFLVLMGARKCGDYLYAWGGESGDEGGYDCSGFISTILTETARAWPELYDGQRRTAAGLLDYYRGRGCRLSFNPGPLRPGMLVFYSGENFVYHVALHCTTVPPMAIGPVGPIGIEAGGSGSGATSPRAALVASAGVRLTASDAHGTAAWSAIDPFEVFR